MPYNEVWRPKSRAGIKELFQLISERHGRRHELVLCEHIDNAPQAFGNWPRRGIPRDHWPLVAELSGTSVEAVAALHRRIRRKTKYEPFPLPL
jgi:hypothetical protein